MQYMMMLYLNEGEWPKMNKAQQDQRVAAYGSYIEALKKAGGLIGTGRLQPTSTATTVRVADGKPHVQDGPFADTKEQLGGYFLIEAPDLDAALSWAARCPTASHGTVEVRPLWAM